MAHPKSFGIIFLGVRCLARFLEKKCLARSDSCILQIVNNKSKLLDLARCYCLEKKFGGRWLFCPTPPYNGYFPINNN